MCRPRRGFFDLIRALLTTSVVGYGQSSLQYFFSLPRPRFNPFQPASIYLNEFLVEVRGWRGRDLLRLLLRRRTDPWRGRAHIPGEPVRGGL